MNPRILMQCRASYRVLSDYLDGELGLMDRMWLRGHLMMCARCRVYLEQFRKVHELTGQPQPEDLPQDFDEVFARVLRRWKDGD